jgi:DnaK suppressor protein
MTKTELKAFRTTLAIREAELANGSRNRNDLAVETNPEEFDRIQHASARDCAMDDHERRSDRLREVRAALRRIDAGTFGICAGCEEGINPKRLRAVPWAARCVMCQEAAEREQKALRGEIDASLAVTA